MKKIIISVLTAFALTCLSANAQFYLGGSVGLSNSSLDEGNTTTSGMSLKLIPNLGYEINGKLSVGASVGFMKGYAALGSFDLQDIKSLMKTATSIASEVGPYDISGFSFAPYVRYTFLEGRRFNLFISGVLSYNSATIKTNQGGTINSRELSAIEISGKPGFSINFDKHFRLVGYLGSIGLQTGEMANTNTKLTRFGLDLDGTNLLFGVEYYF